MDNQEFSNPIAMAKPARGREMESLAVAKGLADTATERGDLDVVHEGYVDGKLYLVPDSNLEAMRDIVNLKMRRKHSSVLKPQTSLNEPTQFMEFNTKMDNLLRKVDHLDKSASSSSSSSSPSPSSGEEQDDEEEKEEEEEEKEEEPAKEPVKAKSKRKSKTMKKPSVEDAKLATIAEEEDSEPQKNVQSQEKEDRDTVTETVPPLLDDNIKYIKVRPSVTSTSSLLLHNTVTHTQRRGLPVPKQLFSVHHVTAEGSETEQIRILLSGHLREGKLPIFILHECYKDTSLFQDENMDFLQRRREGNVELVISGKFYADSILNEEKEGSPAWLDLRGHKLVLDKNSCYHSREFKDVFDLGYIDVVLEGQFIKDNLTLKYTPILSMEIVKKFKDLNDYNNFLDNELSRSKQHSPSREETVFRGMVQDHPPFTKTGRRLGLANKNEKHVHYHTEKEQIREHVERSESAAKKPSKGLMQKIRGNTLYKKLFSGRKSGADGNNKGTTKSSIDQLRQRVAKDKIEPASSKRRARLQEKMFKQGLAVRASEDKSSSNRIGESSTTTTPSARRRASARVSGRHGRSLGSEQDTTSSTSSPSARRRASARHGRGAGTGTEQDTISHASASEERTSSDKPRQRRKKQKQDKNQAIVENPILAQMQQFFIAV